MLTDKICTLRQLSSVAEEHTGLSFTFNILKSKFLKITNHIYHRRKIVPPLSAEENAPLGMM